MNSKASRQLLKHIALDRITDLEVLEVGEADAALLLTRHFLDLVLEVAERLDLALPDLRLVAEDPVLLLRDERAVEHLGARDLAELADIVDRLDLGMALDDLLVLRRQQIEHAVLDVVQEFVDDAEGIDPHAVVTGLLLDAGIGSALRDLRSSKRRS